jgi:cytochrome c oxidase cbb3-type subunit 2
MHWITAWRRVPETLADLRASGLNRSPAESARIVKFGIPGTDMPGHEYLSDHQIASVVLWLRPTEKDAPQP